MTVREKCTPPPHTLHIAHTYMHTNSHTDPSTSCNMPTQHQRREEWSATSKTPPFRRPFLSLAQASASPPRLHPSTPRCRWALSVGLAACLRAECRAAQAVGPHAAVPAQVQACHGLGCSAHGTWCAGFRHELGRDGAGGERYKVKGWQWQGG